MGHEGELIIDTTGVGSESTLRQAQPRHGGVILRLEDPATFTVEVSRVPDLKITNEGGSVRIDLGYASNERLVLGDSFRAFINDFLTAKFDAHVHQLPSGQSTTPPHPAFTGAAMPEALITTQVRAR